MSTFYLGWASTYYDGGLPDTEPFLKDNEGVGQVQQMFDKPRLDIDEGSSDPVPHDAIVTLAWTFTPANGVPYDPNDYTDYDLPEKPWVGTTVFREGGPLEDGLIFATPNEPFFGLRKGTYTFTGAVGSVEFANRAILTVSEGGYGQLGWYCDDVGGGASPAKFWKNFVYTTEGQYYD